MLDSITIRKGQSAVDLALQHYGSLEGLFEVAGLNGVAVHGIPEEGVGYAVPVLNGNTRYLAAYVVATALDKDRQGGIGYWAIGVDFIVS